MKRKCLLYTRIAFTSYTPEGKGENSTFVTNEPRLIYKMSLDR